MRELEACRSTLLGLLAGKDVLVGCIDVATNEVETPERVAETIRRAMAWVPAERLYPCTNCGMVPLPRDVARGKLRALGAGAGSSGGSWESVRGVSGDPRAKPARAGPQSTPAGAPTRSPAAMSTGRPGAGWGASPPAR